MRGRWAAPSRVDGGAPGGDGGYSAGRWYRRVRRGSLGRRSPGESWFASGSEAAGPGSAPVAAGRTLNGGRRGVKSQWRLGAYQALQLGGSRPEGV